MTEAILWHMLTDPTLGPVTLIALALCAIHAWLWWRWL